MAEDEEEEEGQEGRGEEGRCCDRAKRQAALPAASACTL